MYNYNSGCASRNIWVFWSSLSQRKISRRNIPSGRPNQSLIWMYFRKDSLHRFSGIFGNIWFSTCGIGMLLCSELGGEQVDHLLIFDATLNKLLPWTNENMIEILRLQTKEITFVKCVFVDEHLVTFPSELTSILLKIPSALSSALCWSPTTAAVWKWKDNNKIQIRTIMQSFKRCDYILLGIMLH